jgi:hypothetical protein
MVIVMVKVMVVVVMIYVVMFPLVTMVDGQRNVSVSARIRSEKTGQDWWVQGALRKNKESRGGGRGRGVITSSLTDPGKSPSKRSLCWWSNWKWKQ